jgi:hypothetical protein
MRGSWYHTKQWDADPINLQQCIAICIIAMSECTLSHLNRSRSNVARVEISYLRNPKPEKQRTP